MKNIFFPILFLFLACKQEPNHPTAQEIIDKTIEYAGGSVYDNSYINFTFREVEYSSNRKNGFFEFTRKFTDSLGEVEDVLNNSGFNRYLGGKKMALADSIAEKYSNSLNSVIYFVQLPHGLNDAAVQKELVGEAQVKGKEYYKVRITFDQEDGGTDPDDVYMYWINKKDFTVDYFAYKFYSGEGGIRFREAYNTRNIGGLRFVDYRNYKIEPWESVDLTDLGEMYEAGKLEFLSDIKTEDVTVEHLSDE